MKKIIATLCFTILSHHAFAYKNDMCPSVEFIKKTHFAKVQNFMDRQHWLLTSEPYTFDDQLWETNFLFTRSIHSSSEALSYGQNYFDTKIQLTQPVIEEYEGERNCMYIIANDMTVFAKNLRAD